MGRGRGFRRWCTSSRRAPTRKVDASAWRGRLSDGELAFADLLRLGYWRSPGADASPAERQLGEDLYDPAVAEFKQRKRGAYPDREVELAIFPATGVGVFLTPGGTLWYTVMERWIGFDWSAALQLLDRVDGIAKQAIEWWPPLPEPAAGEAAANPGPPPAARSKRRRLGWRQRRQAAHDRERQPHAERAYNLATALLSAVNIERLARADRDSDGKGGGLGSAQPGAGFLARMKLLEAQVVRAERLLLLAAQRNAQVRYGLGMIWGVGLLLVLCGAAAVAFDHWGVAAWVGVAALTGGIGAVVSVLQRMASGKLRLDHNSGLAMLRTLGAVRPIVGAVLGMALFALLEGGWIPSLDVTGDPLAFYAGLGFLAGLNERFAQDMLVGSARQMTRHLQPSTAAPGPAAAESQQPSGAPPAG